MRFGDGPRRRRMIRGTIARIGELAMRHGRPSQLATLDCTSSRRSTVMCARPRATVVTTVYQRDSSSKRPRSSVVSAARAPTPRRSHESDTASRAARPAGGAFGAPGPRAWLVRKPSYRRHAYAWRHTSSVGETTGLDKGSFHIRLGDVALQIAFNDRSESISLADSPASSLRIRSVCWPSAGGAKRTAPGVSESLIGTPSTRIAPAET